MILIAGPCVIEDSNFLKDTIKYIIPTLNNRNIDFYFKASCIKDNRTSMENYGGVGMYGGIQKLLLLKKEFGYKITTDFHNVNDITTYGSSVDLIQIPAYLAQQTSLLREAVKTGKPIHIKKPQFLGPIEANTLLSKLKEMGYEKETMISDRGTMFGYNQTMMDPRHISLLRADKVLTDITHPNKNYPGNAQENALILAMSSIASGSNGLFLETASNCTTAKCDSGTMLSPENFIHLIDKAYKLWEIMNDK